MATDNKLSTSELLFRSASRLGLRPEWVVSPSVMAIQYDGYERYIQCGKSNCNSQLAAGLSKNKVATRAVLDRHGHRNIPYLRATSLQQAREFLAEHGTIIAKPVAGFGSKDIHIISDARQLDALSIFKNILEKYTPGTEMRYLVVDDAVIAVHESRYGSSVAPDRALERISYEKHDWNTELMSTARDIARILGLRFTAIDFMLSAEGEAYVLEVNSSPGLKWFHNPTRGPVVDVATLYIQSMLNQYDIEHAQSQPNVPMMTQSLYMRPNFTLDATLATAP